MTTGGQQGWRHTEEEAAVEDVSRTIIAIAARSREIENRSEIEETTNRSRDRKNRSELARRRKSKPRALIPCYGCNLSILIAQRAYIYYT